MKKTHRHREQVGEWAKWVKGVKYMVMDGHNVVHLKHIMLYTNFTSIKKLHHKPIE